MTALFLAEFRPLLFFVGDVIADLVFNRHAASYLAAIDNRRGLV